MKDVSILSGGCASTFPRAQTSAPPRILVVEDDPFLRQLNAEVLLHSGYAVEEAVDGAAAWELLQAARYDLMITDNNMPKISGVELIKKLRDRQINLPVIMATGTLPRLEANQNPWGQSTALLLKPYTIDELLETVKQVLLAATSAGRLTENSVPIDPGSLVKTKVLESASVLL